MKSIFFDYVQLHIKEDWLHIGNPNAGTRLSDLFTFVENCRLAALDLETYHFDIIARLPNRPLNASRIAYPPLDW